MPALVLHPFLRCTHCSGMTTEGQTATQENRMTAVEQQIADWLENERRRLLLMARELGILGRCLTYRLIATEVTPTQITYSRTLEDRPLEALLHHVARAEPRTSRTV